jgi:hypothetical protein
MSIQPDKSIIGLSTSDGVIDMDDRMKAVVGITMGMMGSLAAGGLILAGLGVYYAQEISGGAVSDGFIFCGSFLVVVGVFGILAAKLRKVTLMMISELVLLALFIALYSVTIITIMLATETTNPVTFAIDKAWAGGFRGEVLETVTSRWCKEHTGNLGACKLFYEDTEVALRRQEPRCEATVTEMALDCEVGVGTPCFVSRLECQACDDLCKDKYKDHIMDQMGPAATVSYVVLGFTVVAGSVMTYLTKDEAPEGVIAKLGLLINVIVVCMAFLGMIYAIFAITGANTECPSGQDCASATLYAILGVNLGLMLVAVLAALGIQQGKLLFMRIANLLYVLLSLLLLMMAILLSVAAGTISDLDTYYNDNWPRIRAELDVHGWCEDVDPTYQEDVPATCVSPGLPLINLNNQGGDGDDCVSFFAANGPNEEDCTLAKGSIMMADGTVTGCSYTPWYFQGDLIRVVTDPLDDPCKEKIKAETASSATVISVIACVTLGFMVAALYFNQKTMKMIKRLLDDTEVLGQNISKAKKQVAQAKKDIKREAEELEQQLRDLKAS